MTLDRKKLGLIHIGKARLGLGEDDYRALLRRVAGVDSAAELSPAGFTAVMHELERLGFRSTFMERNLGHRPGMASPEQVAKIRHLWSRFTDGEGKDASLGKWLEKRGWGSSIRFLTADTAHRAIGALMVMNRKKGRAA